MADLVTHLCTALLPAGLVGTRFSGVFALGACLPDLMGRIPGKLFRELARGGLPVPEPFIGGFTALHWPIGSTLVALVLVQWVEARDRARALAWLVGGMSLHQLTDLLQNHFGQPDPVLYPLFNAGAELAWFSTEDSVTWAPWLAMATAMVWLWRWWRVPEVTNVGDERQHFDSDFSSGEQ